MKQLILMQILHKIADIANNFKSFMCKAKLLEKF